MELFWIWVLVSFALGGVVVSGVTVLGERLGTRIGGLIGTLPHLIIISFYFIGYTQGTEVATEAAVSVPTTMGVNAIFLLLFYKVARWNRYAAPAVSMIVWSLMVLPIVFIEIGLWASLVLYFTLVPLAYILFEKGSDLPSRKMERMRYTSAMMAGRGVLAGGVIAFSVVAARYAGPIVGGIFSVFPALFLSTMLIYTFEHDADYAGAMGKTMSVGGTSVLAFAITCHLVYPVLGLDLGTLAGFLVAVVTSITLYPVVSRMR